MKVFWATAAQRDRADIIDYISQDSPLAAIRILAQLDAAPSVSFMKAPPGNDLKEYDGAWHVRINDQWRLTFKWGESGPYDVLIEDPH